FRASVLAEGDVLGEEEFPQIRAQVEGVVRLDTHEEGDAKQASNPVAAAAPVALPAHAPTRFGKLNALDERGNVRSLAAVELEMIKLAIDHYNGQMSEVARRLGIGRSTLYRKLKEYGLDSEEGRVERMALTP